MVEPCHYDDTLIDRAIHHENHRFNRRTIVERYTKRFS